MNEIVGIGAAVFDTLITVNSYPAEDTKKRAEGTAFCGGGPAATGIVTASKLGRSCGFIGVLADDFGGQFLLEDFIKYKVDTSTIEVKQGYRSFNSYILLNKEMNSRTCIFDKGNLPPLTLSFKQLEAVKNARLLMVDGNEMDAAVEASAIAREHGVKVLYDAGGLYPDVEQLLPFADILIPSEEFALAFTGKKDVWEAAQLLYTSFHPDVVVITRGKLGGILTNGSQVTEYPAYPADVIDTNGAGDVFHGAFAAALLNGYTYEQACHFSSAVSALKCSGLGARESIPTYEETINHLRRNDYHEL